MEGQCRSFISWVELGSVFRAHLAYFDQHSLSHHCELDSCKTCAITAGPNANVLEIGVGKSA